MLGPQTILLDSIEDRFGEGGRNQGNRMKILLIIAICLYVPVQGQSKYTDFSSFETITFMTIVTSVNKTSIICGKYVTIYHFVCPAYFCKLSNSWLQFQGVERRRGFLPLNRATEGCRKGVSPS